MGNCKSHTDSHGNRQAQLGKYSEDYNEERNLHVPSPKIHSSSILHVAAEKNYIASCSDDRTIALTEISNLIGNSNYAPIIFGNHSKAVNKVMFHHRGTSNHMKLFSASRDLSIKLWNLGDPLVTGSQSLMQEWQNAHSLNITALGKMPTKENLFVSGSRDYSLKIWDIETAKCLDEYKVSRNIVTAITSTPHLPNIVFQSSEDLTVKLWDVRQPSGSLPTATISGFVYFALTMDICDNGNTLATGCKGFNSIGCDVFLWDLRKLPDVKDYKNNHIFNAGPLHDFQGHSQDVTACVFSSIDKSYLFSASKDGTLYAWNISDKSSYHYRFPKKYITSMTIVTPDEANLPSNHSSRVEYLALSCMDGSLVIMLFHFDKLCFTLMKSTMAAFETDEIDY